MSNNAVAHKSCTPLYAAEIEKNESNPERNLLAAMMARAIRDLTDTDRHNRRTARKWINSRAPSKRWGTFLMVCEQFGLCPDFLRHQIKRYAAGETGVIDLKMLL